MPDPQVAPQPTDPTITDVPRTGKERVLGAVGGLLGAAGMSGGEPADPRTGGLAAMMDQQHQQRLMQAKRHQQDMITAASILHTGIDPQTNAPLTDQQKAYYKQMYTDSGAAYGKIAGVSPEAKKAVQQHQAVMDHVISAGQQKQGMTPPPAAPYSPPPQGSPGAATGAGLAQGAVAGVEKGGGQGMTPPPGVPGDANGGGVSPAPSTVTPPPSAPSSKKASLISKIKTSLRKFQDDGIDYGPGTAEEMVAPLIRQEMQDNRQVALVGREYGAQEAEAVKGKLLEERKGIEQRIQMVAEHPEWGLKPGSPQYMQFISGGRIGGASGLKATPLQRAVQGSAILASDPNMATESGGAIDPSKTYDVMQDSSGSPFAMESGQTAGMRTPTIKYMPGGPPMGVQEGGDLRTPDSPDWTADDQRKFDAANKSYDTAFKNREKLQEMYATSRAKAYSQSRVVSLYNTETDGLEEVTVWDASHAPPGKYVASSPAMKVKLANATFNEIDLTTDMVNQAIKALPNEAFDTTARTQMALVLKSEDVASAWDLFKGSQAATTLSKEQLNYVSALKDLAETAATLRGAGAGATSDKMRGLIQGMLPGPGTPSKVYAERQMKLFQQEVGQLRKGIPKMGADIPKQGAGMTPPPGAATSSTTTATSTSAPKTWAELKKQAAQQQAPPQ